MLRLEHPVILVGEEQELVLGGSVGLGMMLGELGPEPQAFAKRHAIVVVAVNDEHGRHDVADAEVRRVVNHSLRRKDTLPVL